MQLQVYMSYISKTVFRFGWTIDQNGPLTYHISTPNFFFQMMYICGDQQQWQKIGEKRMLQSLNQSVILLIVQQFLWVSFLSATLDLCAFSNY